MTTPNDAIGLSERLRRGHNNSGIGPLECKLGLEELDALQARVKELEAETEELNFTFDFQWEADQRAIKAWQAAHPDRPRIWPDRCDMVIWLLEGLAAVESSAARAEQERDEALERAVEAVRAASSLDHNGYVVSKDAAIKAIRRLAPGPDKEK